MVPRAGAAGLAWRVLSPPPREDRDRTSQRPAPPDPGPADPVKPIVPAATRVLLDVRTDPADATLRIENREWKTPIVLNETQVAPGSYDVVISKPGFKPVKDRVTLTVGQSTVVLDKKLEREARKVAFTVASDPPVMTTSASPYWMVRNASPIA